MLSMSFVVRVRIELGVASSVFQDGTLLDLVPGV